MAPGWPLITPLEAHDYRALGDRAPCQSLWLARNIPTLAPSKIHGSVLVFFECRCLQLLQRSAAYNNYKSQYSCVFEVLSLHAGECDFMSFQARLFVWTSTFAQIGQALARWCPLPRYEPSTQVVVPLIASLTPFNGYPVKTECLGFFRFFPLRSRFLFFRSAG